MFTRLVCLAFMGCLCGAAAAAEALTPEQQEVWKVERQQWKMSADKDLSWVDQLLHANLRIWGTGEPLPRDKASVKQWSRLESESSTVLEQEILPISVTITGNVAVAQYYYMLVRENYKKEHESVTGHYTDVLIKEGGKWQFIAWSGGDDPKK